MSVRIEWDEQSDCRGAAVVLTSGESSASGLIVYLDEGVRDAVLPAELGWWLADLDELRVEVTRALVQVAQWGACGISGSLVVGEDVRDDIAGETRAR